MFSWCNKCVRKSFLTTAMPAILLQVFGLDPKFQKCFDKSSRQPKMHRKSCPRNNFFYVLSECQESLNNCFFPTVINWRLLRPEKNRLASRNPLFYHADQIYLFIYYPSGRTTIPMSRQNFMTELFCASVLNIIGGCLKKVF